MIPLFRLFLLASLFIAPPALAQQQAWVQVEAQPSLAQAESRARAYATRLPDVNGFSLGSGWYAIVLGPYDQTGAEALLRRYRAEGRIPGDSYVTFSARLGQRFWPIGAGNPMPDAETQAETRSEPVSGDNALPETAADESPREARASEAALDREQRARLQEALQWAGFYRGTIDAAFGRGTRAAMADWQVAQGFEPTGILTTRQRAELLRAYNAVLEDLELERVTDAEAGIELALPLGAVRFDRHEYPFAHYEATGEVPGAQVLLISQAGDRETLHGLYDIMQTLEIVPLEGPRGREEDSFTLVGQDAELVSHTEVRLDQGEIKGFTLVWPAGDEERRTRLLDEIRASFTPLPGTLDPAAGAEGEQAIDLVSGLQVRQPKLSRSGFYIDAEGTVVTSAEAVQGCTRITLDGTHDAQVAAEDRGLGVAVLRPAVALAPSAVAELAGPSPRLQSEVAVSGFSFGGILPAPTLTYGRLAELRGLNGEETMARLALASLPGDAGGPVFDGAGAVLGMLLPRSQEARQLPEDVSFAADAAAIRSVLDRAGVPVSTSESRTPVAPEDLTRLATGMTVLVSCWD
ncbi:MAG: trypsin-like peptidase domain-containing protein [Paracoccaceae bacterium]